MNSRGLSGESVAIISVQLYRNASYRCLRLNLARH